MHSFTLFCILYIKDEPWAKRWFTLDGRRLLYFKEPMVRSCFLCLYSVCITLQFVTILNKDLWWKSKSQLMESAAPEQQNSVKSSQGCWYFDPTWFELWFLEFLNYLAPFLAWKRDFWIGHCKYQKTGPKCLLVTYFWAKIF